MSRANTVTKFTLRTYLALIFGFYAGLAVGMFVANWKEIRMKSQWVERYRLGYKNGYELRQLDDLIKKRDPSYIPRPMQWKSK